MNPYRMNDARTIELRRTGRGGGFRKTIGILLVALHACGAYFAFRSGMWGLWIVVTFYATIITVAQHRRKRAPIQATRPVIGR